MNLYSTSKFLKIKRKHFKTAGKSLFWFFVGAALGLFLVLSFIYIIFVKHYENVVYPGIEIGGVNVGGLTESQVENYFREQNKRIENISLSFKNNATVSTISAKDLEMGFNSVLLSNQAISLGRSKDPIANASIIIQSYVAGLNLEPSYSYSSKKLEDFLEPVKQNLQIDPVDALFSFQNGKVSTFRPSSEGQTLDTKLLQDRLETLVPQLFHTNSLSIEIPVTVKKLLPNVTTDKANNLGIKELVGSGTSLFQHSIESRIYNVTLAAARLNGILVAPGETFSFAKALGDVSAFTGYKQAYVIQNGKTVLGDGGGVCQVSTTLFRAVLNAGIPVVERHAHAYRVGYYEQDSPVGFDATVYVPSVDFRFKNDTGNNILIQTVVDPNELRLTFNLYGSKDGRSIDISKPVITNQSPAPPDSYQDDPTLQKGVVKQVDFSAPGATSTFQRTVTKNGRTLIAETYVSNYQPWQAVFLRGTKE